MLSRRHLRIKVMQALYAYQRSEGEPLAIGEKFLLQSVERVYDLFIHELSLLLELRKAAIRRMEDGRKKHRPTEDELSPNLRFIENPVLLQLEQNGVLAAHISKRKIDWTDHSELIRKTFVNIMQDGEFIAYMDAPVPNYRDHKRMVQYVFDHYLIDNEDFEFVFEEKSIFWVNDFEQVGGMVARTLHDFKEDSEMGGLLPPLYTDPEEDRQFMLDLFRKTATHNADLNKVVAEKTKNWDTDRIAAIDILLLKMAICEFMHLPSIPARVTMNEYIEIAKEYSTPKSKVFINGILDKALADLKAEGKVKKVGKGLIGG
ncbi:MAG: transcription antitermination factor NusB [Flavobacteriales bacterium]|nr:transcription antitermination factor NusB [Flavobacteriales bacterium]